MDLQIHIHTMNSIDVPYQQRVCCVSIYRSIAWVWSPTLPLRVSHIIYLCSLYVAAHGKAMITAMSCVRHELGLPVETRKHEYVIQQQTYFMTDHII